MISSLAAQDASQTDVRVFQILNEVLRFTSEEMRVYLGKDCVIDIMSPLYEQEGANREPFDRLYAEMVDVISTIEAGFKNCTELSWMNLREPDIVHQLTRRFLIDLAAPLEETL